MIRIIFFSFFWLNLFSCKSLEIPPIQNLELLSKADSIAYSYISSHKLIGVTAGVLKDDKIIWQNGFGYLDVEKKIKADSNMVHRLASITKPMTATSILQLVEKGILDLDVPIQKYLPDYPVKKEGDITIRMLLNHTSGTPAYRYFSGENRPTKNYSTLVEATNKFKNRRLKHKPGTKYFYTSYGYTILGAIIEEVTGMSYQAYMQENIWTPCGMTNTSTEEFAKTYKNKSRLYKKTKRGFKYDKVTDLSIKYPAGGVQSTAGDMLRFAKAMLNNKLIKKETKKSAFQIPAFEKGTEMEYGLGWITYTFEEKDGLGFMFYHDGHQSGTSTVLYILPEKRLAVVALANSSKSNSEVQSLARELRALYSK